MNVSATIRDEYSESLSSASILVIDDEPGMRHFMTKILEPRCKRVEQAASAREVHVWVRGLALMWEWVVGLG